MFNDDERHSLLLKIPQDTQKNLSKFKCLEVRHRSPEVSASPGLGSVEVKGLQINYLAGCTQMSCADTIHWNVKGKPLKYDIHLLELYVLLQIMLTWSKL